MKTGRLYLKSTSCNPSRAIKDVLPGGNKKRAAIMFSPAKDSAIGRPLGSITVFQTTPSEQTVHVTLNTLEEHGSFRLVAPREWLSCMSPSVLQSTLFIIS
ncbi:unnamed protein product [Nezara viridula]|uniref:Uncharacterized protein n=1 Tax=Nezara viridula TaxID=85310 RepID=A0A9P0H4W4_NEZVI|nr:unnamed protein product [Nezara viridula]